MQTSAQTVDLVNADHIDLPLLRVFQKAFEGGTFRGPAAIAAVIVPFRQAYPPLAFLTGDIGFSRLALSVKAVEYHVEAFFRAFSCVDRYTLDLVFLHIHPL